MDVLYTPVCVGILPELFRKRAGVRRSLHLTHSVAAIGRGAEEFLAGEENVTTPCPAGGVYHRLYTRGAQIMLIGVNFTRNTYIHGVEEWEHVPGTLTEGTQDLYVVDYEGKRHHTPQHRHCAPRSSRRRSEGRAGRNPRRRNDGWNVWRRKIFLSDARRLRDTVARIFSIDPAALMDNEPLDERF